MTENKEIKGHDLILISNKWDAGKELSPAEMEALLKMKDRELKNKIDQITMQSALMRAKDETILIATIALKTLSGK